MVYCRVVRERELHESDISVNEVMVSESGVGDKSESSVHTIERLEEEKENKDIDRDNKRARKRLTANSLREL